MGKWLDAVFGEPRPKPPARANVTLSLQADRLGELRDWCAAHNVAVSRVVDRLVLLFLAEAHAKLDETPPKGKN